jgi:hypothetical protein
MYKSSQDIGLLSFDNNNRKNKKKKDVISHLCNSIGVLYLNSLEAYNPNVNIEM